MIHDSYINGKRYLPYARCSTKAQGDNSVEQQLGAILSFGTERGATATKPIVRVGVSASIEWNVDEFVREVKERLDRGEQFDFVFVFDESRLTRGGPLHSSKVRYDLLAMGVDVIGVTRYIEDPRTRQMITTFDAMAAQAHAEAIATNASRGAQQSLEDGRRAHCAFPPYGIDKLITTSEGEALWILRHLADGSQEQYNAKTKELIRTYKPNDGRGGSTHYIKSRQERATLCPGMASLHAHVVRMFTAFDIESMSCEQIAKESNDAMIPSPSGGRWNASAVHSILHNPTYLGMGYANQRSSALKVKRSHNAPERVTRSQIEMMGRKSPPMKFRPREDWVEIEYPLLSEYLQSPLRDIAERRIEKHLKAKAKGHTPTMRQRSPLAASYLLSGIIRSKQLNLTMRGHSGGTQNVYRYYVVQGRSKYNRDGERYLRKSVPAEPIESAVLNALQNTLCRMPALMDEYLSALQNERKIIFADNVIDQLRAREEKLLSTIDWLTQSFDANRRDYFTERLEASMAELDDVREQLATADIAEPPTDDELRPWAQAVRNGADLLADATFAEKRRLVELFVKDCVIDMKTLECEITLAMPDWMKVADDGVGLPSTFACRVGWWTKLPQMVWKADFEVRVPSPCLSAKRKQPKLLGCGACRRKSRMNRSDRKAA